MISQIFASVGQAVSAFTTALGGALNGITSMFFDSEAGTLTVVGTLLTIAVGVGLVYWAFNLIRSLIKRA